MSKKPLFKLGQIVSTPGAIELGVDLLSYLSRHITGDWGDMCDKDKIENNDAVKVGNRVFSSYQTPAGKLWIITEADRSSTTFLLPDEY